MRGCIVGLPALQLYTFVVIAPDEDVGQTGGMLAGPAAVGRHARDALGRAPGE